MLYSVVGTKKEVREKAHKEFAVLGNVSHYLYAEQSEQLRSFIDATSLFGDPIIIVGVSFTDNAFSKDILVSLLEDMKESKNIFIIDEPFGDVHISNKLSKVSEKFFNAKEEKVKDGSVFIFCDSFARRDKKQAWIDLVSIRETVEPEAIQGALWWKFQFVWQDVREGKRSPFSLVDCEKIGGEIIRSSIEAHRGEKSLFEELERITLSL